MAMTRTSGSIAAIHPTPIGFHVHAPTLPGIHGRRDLQLALLAKRVIDVTLSGLLLLISMPILLLALLAICLTSPGYPVFRQRRIGLHGAEFTMYKLRTMVSGADREEAAIASQRPDRIFFKGPDDPRVTFIGQWLRKYSIDEIPQFWNVVRGDMSLVGPRPLLATDWRNFPNDHRRRRVWMRPGLTGLWQVSGRNLCDDEERMRLDFDYVDRWTITLDLKILLRTPVAVLSARGAC